VAEKIEKNAIFFGKSAISRKVRVCAHWDPRKRNQRTRLHTVVALTQLFFSTFFFEKISSIEVKKNEKKILRYFPRYPDGLKTKL